MYKQLLRRLNNTWQKIPRSRLLIAKTLKLCDQEYRLWDLFLSLYDWDTKHGETFGIVAATDKDISEILGKGWSESKVSRHRNALLEKGILHVVGKSSYRVSRHSDLQEAPSTMHERDASVNELHASMQSLPEKNRRFSIVSYKDSVDDRNGKDYEGLYREGGYKDLTSEDMTFLGSPEYLNGISWCKVSPKSHRSQVPVEELSLNEIREALCPT